MEQTDAIVPEKPPRMWSVLAMVALTALTFSYLGSYAITNALVAENVMSPWPTGQDPRPRRLVIGFCVLMLVFMAAGEVVRQMSKSDFRAIDEMARAEDGAEA
jgi:hypothetical protein